MQTGKANYRLAARLRGNELLLDADLRKAVEEEHLRAVRRAEGLKCCADRRAFAESVEWERLGDFWHSCISPWQYNHVIQRLWTL